MSWMTAVRIEPWSDHDLPLLERLLGDPAMMSHLGGPESPAKIAGRHARYLAHAAAEPQFRVVDGVSGEAVGWVGYWERRWRDADVYEVGWSVLPEFQGRGIASAATGQAIAHAAAARGRRFMHAFPASANGPSNAICRKLGFTFLGECRFEFPPGRFMSCNDWRLDLRGASDHEEPR
jgi:RimJ/RimL family protein N-acetyltransferase